MMYNIQCCKQKSEKSILITLLIIYIFSSPLIAQKLEIFSGLLHNNDVSLSKHSLNFSSYYEGNIGQTIGIALDSVMQDKLRWRFTLQFDTYNGNLIIDDGGLGGYESIEAHSKKSNLALGLYPFSFEIKNKLHINAGALVSYVVHEKLTGKHVKTIMGQSTTINLEDAIQNYRKKLLVAAQLRLAYDIKISKTLVLLPQYLFHLGLNGEFKSLLNAVTFARHYFCVGVKFGM